jgi:hypothetical protein
LQTNKKLSTSKRHGRATRLLDFSFGRLNPRCHPPGDLTALTGSGEQASVVGIDPDISTKNMRGLQLRTVYGRNFKMFGIEKERPVRFSHFTMQNGCRFFFGQMYDVFGFESGALFLAICYILEQKPGLC